MESKILSKVAEAVLQPPATDKYKNLKEKIVAAFTDSEHKKMSKLLEGVSLGDQKPSHLLNEMKRLSIPEMTDELLKTLWLKRLPTQARVMLSTVTTTLPELAKLADKIVEIGNLNSVDAVSSSQQPSDPLQNCILQLTKAVENLQRSQVNQNSRIRGSRSRSRGRSQRSSGNRSNTPTEPSQKRQHEFCWYHFKFGAKADKCGGTNEMPCNFRKN